MEVVAVVVGLGLVFGVFMGMVDTLISTRLRITRRRRFSTWLPTVTWPMFKAAANAVGRLDDRVARSGRRAGRGRDEAILSIYPSLMLLVLIGSWVGFQVVGWALVWWGSGAIEGVTDLVEAMYYSGVVYFTVGFGDVVPVNAVARMFTLVEAFSGVLFIALTVGYLPTLYQAFSERERELLLLDDGGAERITAVTLLSSLLDGSNAGGDLHETLSRWERWVGLVLETHTSHPYLAYFRSQQPGQSWVTAMGMMGDVTLSVIVVQGTHSGQPWRLYRRIVRTLDVIATSLGVEPEPTDSITQEHFTWALDAWSDHGWPVPDDPTAAWMEFRDLRRAYGGNLQGLITHLEAPRGLWGREEPRP